MMWDDRLSCESRISNPLKDQGSPVFPYYLCSFVMGFVALYRKEIHR